MISIELIKKMRNDENDESSDPWSFRDKEELKKDKLNMIDKITQKVNQTLIKATKKKHNIALDSNYKNYEENKKYIDVFRKNAEKELEIFESERKMNKNKNGLINIDCTLSDLTLGKGIFVTKDDLIFNLPSSFLNKTKMEDIGNSYSINISEINRLIPNDEFVSKLHLFYSQNK